MGTAILVVMVVVIEELVVIIEDLIVISLGKGGATIFK